MGGGGGGGGGGGRCVASMRKRLKGGRKRWRREMGARPQNFHVLNIRSVKFLKKMEGTVASPSPEERERECVRACVCVCVCVTSVCVIHRICRIQLRYLGLYTQTD